MSPSCRLHNRNMPLPNVSLLPYDACFEAHRNPTSTFWCTEPEGEREPEALKRGPNITARERGGRKKQKGMKFLFNPLHPIHLYLYASVQPRCFSSMSCTGGRASSIALAPSCQHCDSISALKQKENSHVVKKGKNCTPSVPFSSLLSSFQSLHIHSRHDIGTLGCFAATVNRASLKTVGHETFSPFTAPEETTTV